MTVAEKVKSYAESFVRHEDDKIREKLGYAGPGDASKDDKATDFNREMKDRFDHYREGKDPLSYPVNEQHKYFEATVDSFNVSDHQSLQDRVDHAKEIADRDFKNLYKTVDKVEHNASLTYPEDVTKAMSKAGIKAQDTWRGDDGTIYFNFKNQKQLAEFNKAYNGDDQARQITGEDNLAYARQQRFNDKWVQDARAKLDEFKEDYSQTLTHSENDHQQAAHRMQETIIEANQYLLPGNKTNQELNYVAAVAPDDSRQASDRRQASHDTDENRIAAFNPDHRDEHENSDQKLAKYQEDIEEYADKISIAAAEAFKDKFQNFENLSDADQAAMHSLNAHLYDAAGATTAQYLEPRAEYLATKENGDELWANEIRAAEGKTVNQIAELSHAIEHGAQGSHYFYDPNNDGNRQLASLEWTDQPITDPAEIRSLNDAVHEIVENTGHDPFANRVQIELTGRLADRLNHQIETDDYDEAQITARALQYILPDRDRDGLPEADKEAPQNP